MQQHSAVMQEVIVKAGTPAILVKKDTVEYRADSFQVRKNADVEELLRKLPGIKVDGEGNVSTQGKPVTRIRVNGKDFFDGNVQMATRSLPADAVDKIQVIDDYGDLASFTAFRTGEPEKIINIQLKKEKSTGYFLKSSLGGGSRSTYQNFQSLNTFSNRRQASVIVTNNVKAGASVLQSHDRGFLGSLSDVLKLNNNAAENLGGINSATALVSNNDLGFLTEVPSPRIGVTHSNVYGGRYNSFGNKHLSFYLSVLNYKVRNNSDVLSRGKRFLNKLTLDEREELSKITELKGQRVFSNVEWRPDSSFSMKAMITASCNSRGSGGQISRLNLLSGVPVGAGYSASKEEEESQLYSATLSLKQKFASSRSALFIESNLVGYNNSSDQNNLIRYSQQSEVNQRQQTESDNRITTVRALYVTPLFAKSLLETGYEYKRQINQSARSLSRFNGSQFEKETELPASINSRFIQHTPSMNWRSNFRKLETTLGVGLQILRSERFTEKSTLLEETDIRPVPFISLSYPFSSNSRLSLRYNGYFVSPSGMQVIPVADTSDPTIVYIGNPALKAESRNSGTLIYVNTNYGTGGLVLFGLTANQVSNRIVPFIQTMATSRLLYSYTNAGLYRDLNFFYNYSRPFNNKSFEVTVGGNVNFSHYSFFNEVLINANAHVVNSSLELTLNRAWGDIRTGGTFTSDVLIIDQQFSRAEELIFSLSSEPKWKEWLGRMYAGYFIPMDYQLPGMANCLLLNLSLEKQLGHRWLARIEGNDLLNTTIDNYRRVRGENTLRDLRTNVLGRNFLISIQFRLSRFQTNSNQKQ